MPRVTITSLQKSIDFLNQQNEVLASSVEEYRTLKENAEIMCIQLQEKVDKLNARIAELERQLSAQQAPAPQESPQPVPSNPKRGRPFRITEETKERVRSLREQGCSMRTIARTVGLSVSTVCDTINGK